MRRVRRGGSVSRVSRIRRVCYAQLRDANRMHRLAKGFTHTLVASTAYLPLCLYPKIRSIHA